MNRFEEENALTEYYLSQAGNGFEIFRGNLYQKGNNLITIIIIITIFTVINISKVTAWEVF